MMDLGMDTIMTGIVWYVAFLFSTVCHEAAHAWAALKLGDPTAYEGGQVSFNPAPHLRQAPIGLIAVPVITFALNGWMMGWASAPYDYHWSIRHPRRSALMSLAGPAANFIIILICAGFVHLGIAMGFFLQPDQITFTHIVQPVNEGLARGAGFVISIFFSLNLILFFFNLLPLPPLDGSGALPLIISARTVTQYQDMMIQPQVRTIGLVTAWFLFSKCFEPIRMFALNFLYPGSNYAPM
jgi:Zn-dependent protease